MIGNQGWMDWMYVTNISPGADVSFLAMASLIWPGLKVSRGSSASIEDDGIDLGDDITSPS
jgi:hypothetical protein